MAKRQRQDRGDRTPVEDFAEDLGKMLGHARNKAEALAGPAGRHRQEPDPAPR